MATFTSPSSKTYKVGVVGATGAVGMEVVKVLFKTGFPVSTLHMYASKRSAGKILNTDYGDLTVEEYTIETARTCDFVFLAVSGDFALENAFKLIEGDGPIVIDNSSAFRYMDHIPLVVPEINSHTLKGQKLIANPNCTTAIAAVVLWPLHQKYTIKKMIVSTYQASSGAGQEGMDELIAGTTAALKGEQYSNTVFAHPLHFNLIPHIDKFQPNGYTKEEMKVAWETRKIFEEPEDNLKITCTAVRIPILRAHSEAITIETVQPVNPDDARELLLGCAGVRVADDVNNLKYPMPINTTGDFDVEVGRIRSSLVFENGLELFVSGDQLLRGAALNAVLIAAKMIEM